MQTRERYSTNLKLVALLAALLLAGNLLYAGPSIFQVYQGGTGLSAVAAHQVLVGTAANVFTAKTLPDCQDSGGNHLNYAQGTDSFACGSSSSGGGGSTPAFTSANVTPARAANTVYQNTSGHPMIVAVGVLVNGTATNNILSDASNPPTTTVASASAGGSGFGQVLYAIIAPNFYYKVTGANITSIENWAEYTFSKGTLTDSGNISGSRAYATTYQNTSGNLMWLAIQIGIGGTSTLVSDSNASPTQQIWKNTISGGSAMTAFVPILNNNYYKLTNSGTGSITAWHEYQLSSFTVVQSQNMNAAPYSRGISQGSSYNKVIFNNTSQSLWTCVNMHTTSTGTLSFYTDPITNVSTNIPPVGNIQQLHSSNNSDMRSVSGGVDPLAYYEEFIDSNTVATVDSWTEWSLK